MKSIAEAKSSFEPKRNGLTIEMCRFCKIIFLIANGLAFAAVNHATAQTLPTDAELRINEVEELSEGSYAQRQRATLEMWRVRDQSRDQVQRAANHPDPEIAGRAQWILRQWRRGSLPGTPPEISRLLAKHSRPAGINQLMVEGQFAAARVAIEESIGTAEYESIRQRVHMTLLGQFPTCVHAGIKHRTLPDLLDLIDAVAESKEVAVSRIELMRELGMDVDVQGLLPQSATTWSNVERIEAEALVLITLGRFDEAIDVAKSGNDKKFLYRCRAIAGQWQDATREAIATAEESEPGSAEHARAWSRVMVCADRANDIDVFNQAAHELVAADVSDLASARDLRWRTLASHGKVDAAVAMLDEFDHESAAQLSIATSHLEHAFEILGFPLDEVDIKSDQWVDAAIESQRTLQLTDANQGEWAEPIDKLLTLIRSLITIGREDVARSIVGRLCETKIAVGSLQLRDHVLDSLRFTARLDWMVDFAISDGEYALTPNIKTILLRPFSNPDVSTLDLVMEALALVDRSHGVKSHNIQSHKIKSGSLKTQTVRDRVADAYTLMQGKTPDGLNQEAFFKKLHDLAIMPGRTSGRRIPGQFPAFAQGRVRGTMGLVRFFLQHGHAEQANAVLRKLAETGNYEALLLLAEQELDAGSTESAEALFEALSETVFNHETGIVIGNTRSDELAIKSLIGLARIAKRNGDMQRADELQTEIRLALITPSTRLRSSIAKYLVDRNENALAMEAFERVLPIVMFDNEERTGIYSVATAYALFISQSDPASAARWFDLGVSDVVQSGGFVPSSNVTHPVYTQRWSLEAAIERKDEPAIRRHLKRIMELDSLDIALAESILPKLRESGWDELADQTLDQIVQIGVHYCQEFPADATTANNLAWVAAMNGQHLETALSLSEQAVYREPDSAVYRDTLAEILFRLGRIDEALQIEQACLLDDSTDWHIHQQVDKYREASQP